MPTADANLADRSGRLVESHRGFDPRVVFFYFVIAGLLVVLTAGLAYQQLFKTGLYHERERQQNQRRILVPGPRGNVYDREGRLLVGNSPRFAAGLFLDELEQEFNWEFKRIRKNYRETGDKDLPTYAQMEKIAQVSVAQRYLDQVDAILGRHDQVDPVALRRHFAEQMLLPYPLLDDLTAEEFARLTEELPVASPVQLYALNQREYPHGSAAAHALGYVGRDDNLDAQDFPGEDLTTFKMKGAIGRDGLEKHFDSQLQGEAGGYIYRVNPAGYKVNPPLAKLLPRQGKNLVTSLDLNLQMAAEQAIGDQTGAAVAIDVRTGEVLVLASKPDYDLSAFSPRLGTAAAADIEKRGAWLNRAVNGLYPPGSTFKVLVTIAGLRSGISPDNFIVDCEGTTKIGNGTFNCDNGLGHHGPLALREAIAESCDIFFYRFALAQGITPGGAAETIAAEGRRFHLDRRTGIELPSETSGMVMPDPAWKERKRGETWFPGDTAHMGIGQGDVLVTPLDMACFAASVARDETYTRPTLLHDPNRPAQHAEAIGLTPAQREALLDGMEGCTNDSNGAHSANGARGTAYFLTTIPALEIPGVRIAGKTGTAQIPGHRDVAWFICFAPRENPRIAVAVALEGDTGEEYGGGRNAGPVASAILRAYFEKSPVSPGSPAGAQTAGLPSPGSPSRDL